MEKYIKFEVWAAASTPTGRGTFIGSTPIYEQAVNACRGAKKNGKTWFIRGVLPSGEKVFFW